jgi:hypothetical protein
MQHVGTHAAASYFSGCVRHLGEKLKCFNYFCDFHDAYHVLIYRQTPKVAFKTKKTPRFLLEAFVL